MERGERRCLWSPREFGIERGEQFPDALNSEHQTRAPMLESMKILRLRNGTGDSRSKWALRLRHGTANTGCERGATSEVQDGGANATATGRLVDHGGHVVGEIRIVNRWLGQQVELITGRCREQVVQIGQNEGRRYLPRPVCSPSCPVSLRNASAVVTKSTVASGRADRRERRMGRLSTPGRSDPVPILQTGRETGFRIW